MSLTIHDCTILVTRAGRKTASSDDKLQKLAAPHVDDVVRCHTFVDAWKWQRP